MTASDSPAVPQRRRTPILAIISVVVAVIAIAPTLVVFLLGFLPDMATIWWLLLATFPWTIGVGFIALVLAIIALILDIRAKRTLVWSIIGVVLSVLASLVPLGFLTGGFTSWGV